MKAHCCQKKKQKDQPELLDDFEAKWMKDFGKVRTVRDKDAEKRLFTHSQVPA